MRAVFAGIMAVAMTLLIPANFASAQNYPWCAQYSARGGARNCGFVSFEQCMATVGVNGGFCEQNFMYRPSENRPSRRKARRPHS